MNTTFDPAIRPAGCFDGDLDLFESQYAVPNGVSYNSWVILDEKAAVLDTVDSRKLEEWLANLEEILEGRAPDYLVIHHMEPDHAGGVRVLADKYPDMKLVGNAKTFPMLAAFTGLDYGDRALVVKEGEELSLGEHTLAFTMAPMVHWPEVMLSFEKASGTLFSADGFGRFGDADPDSPWVDEGRRYYLNIVGKYGVQVQALLKKAAALDIKRVCPLHGPVLSGEGLALALEKYDLWSRYVPEEKGVLVAYASIHGNTAQAAGKMVEILKRKGCPKVAAVDLCREDQAAAVESAFRCGKLAAMSPTYDGGLFPAMDHFMAHLRDKTYRNRRVALIENGSWAPAAAKVMRSFLEAMRDIEICETVHTIQGAVKDADLAAMERIADELMA